MKKVTRILLLALVTVAIMVMTAGCGFTKESDANVSIQFDEQSVLLETDKNCIVDIYVEFDNGTNNAIQDIDIFKNSDNYLGAKKIMKTQYEADDVKVSQVKVTNIKEENIPLNVALLVIGVFVACIIISAVSNFVVKGILSGEL